MNINFKTKDLHERVMSIIAGKKISVRQLAQDIGVSSPTMFSFLRNETKLQYKTAQLIENWLLEQEKETGDTMIITESEKRILTILEAYDGEPISNNTIAVKANMEMHNVKNLLYNMERLGIIKRNTNTRPHSYTILEQ